MELRDINGQLIRSVRPGTVLALQVLAGPSRNLWMLAMFDEQKHPILFGDGPPDRPANSKIMLPVFLNDCNRMDVAAMFVSFAKLIACAERLDVEFNHDADQSICDGCVQSARFI